MTKNTASTAGSVDTAMDPLAIVDPQPVWMTLDEARERSFTGEIVFEVDPEVRAYLDEGVVYYAERTGDPPLGRRLIEAGVLNDEQLERGTVRVGDLQHLGRLFERDTTVDRDAVLVVTETHTDDLIAELATRAVTTVRVTAYRRHPLGVQRWFLTALDRNSTIRSATPPAEFHIIAEQPPVISADDFAIEWDDFDEAAFVDAPMTDLEHFDIVIVDPLRDGVAHPDRVDQGSVGQLEPIVEDDVVQRADDVEELVDDGVADEDVGDDDVADDDLADVLAIEDPLAELDFRVAWPDGTHQSVSTGEVDVIPVDSHDDVFAEADDGELRFKMPPLRLSDDVDTADVVPDDVAAAVRRAIAAIESASTASSLMTDAGSSEITGAVPVVDGSQSRRGFAPPTADMSVEALYAQADVFDDDGEENGAATSDPFSETPYTMIDVSVQSTAVAGSFGDSSHDRSSALRRLISGLRRDH